MIVDVAIVGGGPAGVAAALSLRQHMPQVRVAIFDAGRSARWKPGETLSPAARLLLESLGCWDELQRNTDAGLVLESFGTESVWGSGTLEANDFLFSKQGTGWRLDRARFDAMLLERARAQGTILHREAPLMSSSGQAGQWRLAVAGLTVEARFVIDASGRAARFSRDRGMRIRRADSLTGAFVLFDCRNHAAADSDTLIEAHESGWWYSTSVPGNRLVLAWMSDSDLIREAELKNAAQWFALLAKSQQTRNRVAGAKPITIPMIYTAQSQRLDAVAKTAWAAAGDAAMAFDPLSSHGITKALRSGKLASFVALDWLGENRDTHERYCRIADAEWTQYLGARRTHYLNEQRWPASVFWARRHAPCAQ